MSTSMKTLFLTLCVALALLVGCGRSKPATSRSTSTETLADEAAAEQAKAEPAQAPTAAAPAAPQPMIAGQIPAAAAPDQAPPAYVPPPGAPRFGPTAASQAKTASPLMTKEQWERIKQQREEKRKAREAQGIVDPKPESNEAQQ